MLQDALLLSRHRAQTQGMFNLKLNLWRDGLEAQAGSVTTVIRFLMCFVSSCRFGFGFGLGTIKGFKSS